MTWLEEKKVAEIAAAKRLAVEVDHLTYTFPDGTTALREVSFQVEEQEKLMIIGRNGAGKSTLLLHLNGLLKGKGEIKIFGETINKKNIKKIRAQVGLVFQSPDDQLFMPRVLDEVAFGLFNGEKEPEVIEFKTKKILQNLGIAALASKSPQQLSLGEKKKVSLATVLVLGPKVLVLDEPTSGLDPASRRWLINYLKNFNQTIIAATHDLDFAWEIGSKIMLIDEGQKIAEGQKEEILSNRELLEKHQLEVPLLYLLSKYQS